MTSTTPTFRSSDDTDSRRALVRTLTNQLNQNHGHHRQLMTSHEELAEKAKQYAERSDQGNHAILSMADEISDQIAEGHQQMATKADLAAIAEQLAVIQDHLIQYDHIVIPRDQSNG